MYDININGKIIFPEPVSNISGEMSQQTVLHWVTLMWQQGFKTVTIIKSDIEYNIKGE